MPLHPYIPDYRNAFDDDRMPLCKICGRLYFDHEISPAGQTVPGEFHPNSAEAGPAGMLPEKRES